MEKSYKVSEVAKMLGYSRNSIYGFLKSGRLKGLRIGQGKFRISESEVNRFASSGDTGADVGVTKEKDLVLPEPRPGRSLEDLSGEPPLHTLKLWLEERVVIPRLFDWFVGLSSVVLGMAMFLYSRQSDVLLVGRWASWFGPIRVTLMLSGLGLILADMIQEEFIRYRNLSNYFRAVLFVVYASLSWILFLGQDIDGTLVYGLFAAMILVEVVSGIRSSVAYAIYVQSLFVSWLLVSLWTSGGMVAGVWGFDSEWWGSFSWLGVVMIVMFVLLAAIGYFWNRKVLGWLSAFCGGLLILVSFVYASDSFWDRSFFVLSAGLVGVMIPSWQLLKKKFETDRPMIFKMFGLILMFFSLVVVLIYVIQTILLNDASRNLADKAGFGRVVVEELVESNLAALGGVVENPLFAESFKGGNREGMDSFVKAVFRNNLDLSTVAMIDGDGSVVASYPFSSEISKSVFQGATFFETAKDGRIYISSTVEKLGKLVGDTLIMSRPILVKGEVVGVVVATLNLDAVGERLQRISNAEQQQMVSLVDADGKWIVSSYGAVGQRVGESDSVGVLWSRGSGGDLGYDSWGRYGVFRLNRSENLMWTVVAYGPMFEILDVSRSGLMVVLFLLSVITLTVVVAYVSSHRRKLQLTV